MIIRHRTVGAFQENSYLVVDERSARAILIDPGAEPDALLGMIRDNGATLEAIWLTHAHIDHVGGIAGVLRAHDVPVHMHPLDAVLFNRAADVARMYGIPYDPAPLPGSELAEGQLLAIGDLSFRVMHVPGHAPGHVIFVGEGVMLGGDLLFAGSIGRTDLPYCNAADMQRSLSRLATLEPELVVYPGHGPPTTIERELESNPFLTGLARPLRR